MKESIFLSGTPMLRPLLIAVAFVTALPAAGQEKKADTKAKKTPFDNVEGYKVHQLSGFTVIVSDEVLKQETSKFKRKPVDCIELELKHVVGLVNKKAADALQKVPIWAEWDEQVVMSNGRQGQAYAVYYGGNQLSMLAKNQHPQKAKCVTLLLTRVLTRNYQEKDRPETLVMLHELAHAVHDQMVGRENPEVKAAYQQAMSRKLYDKSLYIATNEAEFFAEASCAFLDRISYAPKDRAALKEHDPETYKLMNAIWGKAAVANADATKAKRPPDGRDEFDFEVTPDKVRWAKPITGEAFDRERTKGRVILLSYIVSGQGAIIRRLREWHEDFEPYGLTIVAANADYNGDRAESAAAIKRLNLPFPVLEATYIPIKGTAQGRADKAGHAILFDADGKCLFRGQADDATIYLREALGRRLFDSLKLSESEIPKQLQPAIAALKAGESVVSVAAKAQPFTTTADATIADPAKKLLAAISDPGTKLLNDAIALKKTDPLEAYILAEKIAVRFKGLPVANKATNVIDALRTDKVVQAEMKARKDLEAVTKIEAYLSGQAGSFAPREPGFQAKHAASLRQLKVAYEVMKKKHPSSKATERAAVIAKEYGIE